MLVKIDDLKPTVLATTGSASFTLAQQTRGFTFKLSRISGTDIILDRKEWEEFLKFAGLTQKELTPINKQP